jgi:F-type H+-transporting ATPase subunit alpha
MALSSFGEVSKKFSKKLDVIGLEGVSPQVTGTVYKLDSCVVFVTGLRGVMAGEVIKFETGSFGIASNLGEVLVGVVLLGSSVGIREGSLCTGTGKMASIGVGYFFLGRVVDPLGNPVDGYGPLLIDPLTRVPLDGASRETALRSMTTQLIEAPAPGIVARRAVCEPLATGVLAVDALIPIGRGQRELIIGDRRVGKTSLVLSAIISATGGVSGKRDVVSVYVGVGQRASSVAAVRAVLQREAVMDGVVIVLASADAPAPLQYLAPYSGAAIAEHFMYGYGGCDTLVVYDDLTKHAVAYREMSLLLRRPPGREAYPGDVFYVHSRLLERAAAVAGTEIEENGELIPYVKGCSMTALPIVETQSGDLSAYIPTNVISITDGQLFLTSELVNAGIFPAVDVGFSVSRVGSAAQGRFLRGLSGGLKLELAQLTELEAFSKLSSDLDDGTKAVLSRGQRLRTILVQKEFDIRSVADQVCLIYAVSEGVFDSVAVRDCPQVMGFFVEIFSGWLRPVVGPSVNREAVVGYFFVRALLELVIKEYGCYFTFGDVAVFGLERGGSYLRSSGCIMHQPVFCLPASLCFEAFRRVGLVLPFGLPLWREWALSGVEVDQVDGMDWGWIPPLNNWVDGEIEQPLSPGAVKTINSLSSDSDRSTGECSNWLSSEEKLDARQCWSRSALADPLPLFRAKAVLDPTYVCEGGGDEKAHIITFAMIDLFRSLRPPRINFFEEIVESGECSIFGEYQLKLYVELFKCLYFGTEGNV